MTPVLAWCERCGGGFPLYAIVRQGTGACPHCQQPLAPDPNAALVDWAAVVDSAYDDLITVVRRLEQPPGHLRINTDQLLQSLAEEIASRSGGGPGRAVDPEGDETASGQVAVIRDLIVRAER